MTIHHPTHHRTGMPDALQVLLVLAAFIVVSLAVAAGTSLIS